MLSIKRPTTTTVLYTVSTRLPPTTLTARTKTYGLLLLRLLAGLSVTLLLLSEYDQYYSPPRRNNGSSTGHLETLLASPPGHLATSITAHLHYTYRLVLIPAISWLILLKSHVSESLLVIRGLGVQTSTSSSSYLWTDTTRFIPTSSIQDIFIHEAFKGFEVRFYLSIVVEGEEGVVVVFPVRPHACE